MKTIFFRSLVLGATLLLGLSLRADPALIGNAALKGQALDTESAKAVLLGKKVTLGNTRVVIIIAKAGAAQDKFLQQSVGMTTSQFQTHWRRLFMTGGGTAPKIVETEAEASKLAAETPGGIAIVDNASAGDLAVLSAK
ncbi:MAG TPA: hypothetical protein VHD62_14180 [Opitutaceae bacterium]|nr:hypothetical protein [Opitutaceae bacterium]